MFAWAARARLLSVPACSNDRGFWRRRTIIGPRRRVFHGLEEHDGDLRPNWSSTRSDDRGPVTRGAARRRSQEERARRRRIMAKRGEAMEGTESMGSQEKIQKIQYGKTSASVAVGSSSASPAAPSSTPSARLRFPPYPVSGKKKDLIEWQKECRNIRAILAADPRLELPTRRKPKDPGTTDAVLSSREKVVVRGVARSIVHISAVTHDGSKRLQCTGIIMGQRESNGKQRTLIVTCSKIISSGHKLLDPVPKLSVGLPNKTIVDGQFLFFNDHYDIALLDIDVDLSLQRPSIGSGLEYGQEVFVLSRDSQLSLRARHGEILWSEESDYIGRSYQMFLSCEVPAAGNGGAVIDHDGNVTGMAFYRSPDTAMLSISTIVTCIEMWLKFSRIARPILGLCVRTFGLLDVSLQEEISLDHGIDSGFIVDNGVTLFCC